jgi:betaine-aldehyde dehydrogenase
VEQADRAVKAAAAAFKTWRKVPDVERAAWLRKLADEVAARKPRICTAETLNCGKPYREAEGDIDDCIAALKYCAGLAEKGAASALPGCDQSALPDPSFTGAIRYEPVGVVVGITPFNFPLMMAGWKVGPALAAGCTVVIKPSEFTPFTTMELAAAAHAIGLPAGVLNVLTGDGKVGAALVEHPLTDKVSFTGSGPTGTKVMASAAQQIKRVTLELGGKSPLVIFDDAELDGALEWTLFGAFFNAGQICSATSRVLVHEKVAPVVIDRLVKAAKAIKVGNGFEEGVEMGPSNNGMQYGKVQAYIKKTIEEGAKLECGGDRPAGEQFAKGFWTAPTIFSGVKPGVHTIWTEEVFGPVMSITTFKDDDEAIALANDTAFGLASAVFTTSEARLERFRTEVRAGYVWENNAQPSPHALPW